LKIIDKKSGIIHLFLFAIFPVVFLYSNNMDILPFEGFLLPLLFVLFLSVSLWIFLRFILHNSKKAGLLVSLYIVLIFTYGHISNLIDDFGNDLIEMINAYLIFLFFIVFIGGTYYFVRTRKKLDNATMITNAIALTIIVLVLVNIVTFQLESISVYAGNIDEENVKFSLVKEENPPDIYYFLLDGYANSKVLEKFLDYDNQEFMSFLREHGFYFSSNYTNSNYPWTNLSLPSILNMEYVNYVAKKGETESQRNQILYKIIDDNIAMQNAKSKGYTVINFDSGWWGTKKINIADENLCSNLYVDYRMLQMLYKTTILSDIRDIGKQIRHYIWDQKRDQILCEFSEVPKLKSKFEEPIFVFVHIVAPHPNWVFGPNGEPIKEFVDENTRDIEKRKTAYVNQLKFVNKKTEEVIDHLLADKENPPIIILQSDHGARIIPEEITNVEKELIKFGNLNAYYLPHGGDSALYETITPVNSFRLIFNYYFNDTYNILEDIAYRPNTEKSNFKDISDILIWK